MHRLAKTVLLTATAAAAVVGSTGAAFADGKGGHDNGSGATAKAIAVGSPGFHSGNVIQKPLNFPMNLCGNTHNHFSLLNSTFGNVCINS
ncbi:chaplin [Streptomyces sp. NPDC059718]